jgi:peptide/nickel transport system ATP-binding protein
VTLAVHELSVGFRLRSGTLLPALAGVTLTFARGEAVGLIGGSGAGKSLVAEAILGALPRNALPSGAVTWDGAPPPRGAIALAPQGIDALDPLARVGAQIERFARLAGRRAEVATLLNDVGLAADVAAAYPHELSGGMAKRALIATALATGAEALLADEPTLGVDPDAADALLALLAGLARAGRAVLIVSHDLPRLVRVTTRITVLRAGRMIETLPANAFDDDATADRLAGATPYTRALWAAQTWRTPC